MAENEFDADERKLILLAVSTPDGVFHFGGGAAPLMHLVAADGERIAFPYSAIAAIVGVLAVAIIVTLLVVGRAPTLPEVPVPPTETM